MNDTFYAVPTIDLGEPFDKLNTGRKKDNGKNKISKFTKVIGQVTDEVKNYLMQIQLSTDILERKLADINLFVSKEEIGHINTGINFLNKTMEDLYYLPPVESYYKKINVEDMWEGKVRLLPTVCDSSEKINIEKDEKGEVEELMQKLVIQTVSEVKNRLMQIQLSADILERKISNLEIPLSKVNYIESINSSVSSLDETMESLLCYVNFGSNFLF